MATKYSLRLFHIFSFCCRLFSLSFSFETNNASLYSPATRRRWSPAGATWYGAANGAGSDGGACGYGNAVGKYPFSSMIAAGSPSVFKAGKGCGACYQVRCTRDHACSKKPVTVVITDECPGGPCLVESVHFDLSGTAIGAMALPRRADRLRDVGVLPVQYTRVPCKFPHKTITFHVDAGSNRNYFAVLIEFADGDGSLSSVELGESKSVNRATWRPMIRSWGALWKLDSGPKLRAPFSIRLTSQHSMKKVVAKNVVPARWRPGATYRSLVNFH